MADPATLAAILSAGASAKSLLGGPGQGQQQLQSAQQALAQSLGGIGGGQQPQQGPSPIDMLWQQMKGGQGMRF